MCQAFAEHFKVCAFLHWGLVHVWLFHQQSHGSYSLFMLVQSFTNTALSNHGNNRVCGWKKEGRAWTQPSWRGTQYIEMLFWSLYQCAPRPTKLFWLLQGLVEDSFWLGSTISTAVRREEGTGALPCSPLLLISGGWHSPSSLSAFIFTPGGGLILLQIFQDH